jgi:hypoxanthine phosphoribosyltransferase
MSVFQENKKQKTLTPAPRREPLWVGDDEVLCVDHYYIPAHYTPYVESLLITQGTIVDRVEKLAFDIIRDYEGQTMHILCVLKGGSTFFQNLTDALRKFHDYARETHIPYTFDFVKVKSYSGTESTKKVEISNVNVKGLAGKNVLIVEDIIDTGNTMVNLLEYLNEAAEPASIRVASFVEKRSAKSVGYKADYVGFSIPDKYVCCAFIRTMLASPIDGC